MTRWRLAGLWATLFFAWLVAPPPAAAQAQDEVVPQGVWRMHVDVSTRTEDKGINRLRHEAPLLDYLVPDSTVRDSLQGGVQRSSKRVDVQATYGLSDRWNLVLGLPWERVTQTSSLTTTSTDPAVLSQLDRLRSRSLSGVGRLQVASLHRPTFTDRDAFTWGYGVQWPLQRPHSPWAGRGTLVVDSPFPRAFMLLHYTFYPFLPRSHLDFRLEGGAAFTRTLALLEGGHASVNPGNDLTASAGWTQAFGRLDTGVSALVYRQGESLISHHRQGDGVSSVNLRLQVGYGNLTELEQGPIAFPYQVAAQYDETLAGFNVPAEHALHVSLRFYF